MAKAYAGIVGAVLLLVGIVGFMTKGMMGMTFYPAHNIIHCLRLGPRANSSEAACSK